MKENTRETKEALEKCPNLVTLSNKYVFDNHEPVVMSIDSRDNNKVSFRNEIVVGIPK